MIARRRQARTSGKMIGGRSVNVIPIAFFLLLFAITFTPSYAVSSENHSFPSSSKEGGNINKRREIRVSDETLDDLVWVVQLSDLHFSVHHPDRAQDFKDIVGPTLALIKPSLVLLTGDLTDGKSMDFLTMKQDEEEWIEYKNVMQDVIQRSGLDKSSFFDVRGNHDNFGVPAIGGSFDFFSKYSINGQLQRNQKVNSITIQTSKRNLLFLGFDSTMSSGLRGPTNFFGHLTDEIVAEINSELLHMDSGLAEPVTKISFGHFPLSFSAASESGYTLKDIFINHSMDAYLCGHLHTKFGKNLKRYHPSSPMGVYSNKLFQLSGHRRSSENVSDCSNGETRNDGFWEWEMGDWRKSRAMRILAIDGGHISFVDIDFKFGAKSTVILPTFPLDSRFTSMTSQNYKCEAGEPSSHRAIRALVFSTSPILSVLAKVYDSSSGNLIVVLETPMSKLAGSPGNLYVAPWHIQAFEDASPDRYLLEIVATDVRGRSTATELRPFSVTGIPARFSWSWKEFLVFGCQWNSLYYPILRFFYILVLSILLIPRLLISFSSTQYTYKNFMANKSFINGLFWILVELYNIPAASFCMIGYLFSLVLFPWFHGEAFTTGGGRAYMTYKGWVSRLNPSTKLEFHGSPDILVVVLPHLYLVILPAVVTMIGLAAESGIYHNYVLSLSSKKKDDHDVQDKESNSSTIRSRRRWFRKFLLVVSLGIFWKHFKSCRAMMKAYDMNPVLHFPLYSFAIPLLLGYCIWRTGRTLNGISTR